MFYLAAQIWLHLGLAFALGCGTVWWYLRRRAEEGVDEVPELAEPQTRALVERLTAEKAGLELRVNQLSTELHSQGKALEEGNRRLSAAESELMDSGNVGERLAVDAATTEEALRVSQSDLQHAREELILKTDELAHRRAEWTEESVSQRRDIESLRGQLRRRRTPPRTGRPETHLEPRLPDRLLLNEEGEGGGEPTGDDLTQIKGVGRVLAGLLNEMGIHTFREIASWTSSDIERIQSSLPQFPGRIRRDDWVAQAADLDQTSRV